METSRIYGISHREGKFRSQTAFKKAHINSQEKCFLSTEKRGKINCRDLPPIINKSFSGKKEKGIAGKKIDTWPSLPLPLFPPPHDSFIFLFRQMHINPFFLPPLSVQFETHFCGNFDTCHLLCTMLARNRKNTKNCFGIKIFFCGRSFEKMVGFFILSL